MPYRTWLFAVALGLILDIGLLQAQEEAEGGQNGANEQQQPTQILPMPLPVQIIEDNESAESRERREDEARQREIDDLEAQQGMNVATQAMNEATQSMKYAAWVSTGFVGVGTFLLIWTLRLTRQAGRSAQDAVAVTRDIGEAQLRAYVDLSDVTWRSHWRGENKEDIFWRFNIGLKNIGATPTKRLKVRVCMIASKETIEASQIPDHVGQIDLTLGAGAAAGVISFDIDALHFAQVGRGAEILYVLIEAIYGNALNPESEHITRIGMRSGAVTGDPMKYWHETDNPVVIKFNHIRRFNCTDDECQ